MQVKNTMKVLFIIRYFHPFVGGTEKQALTLASRLVANGIDVTILTSRFRYSWQRTDRIQNVCVIRLPSPRIKVIGALVFLICLACYLIRYKNHYSIVHTFQIGYTSFVSILLATVLRIPTLIKVASSGSGGDVKRARQTAWGKLCLLMAKKATRIIAVSDSVKRELMQEGVPPGSIESIANGVDLGLYEPYGDKPAMRRRCRLPEKNTIVYAGRLSPEKGIDVLVRSFALLVQSQPCQLLIIADGPEGETVAQLIVEHELNGSVLLVSKVEEVAPYLKASDLFVLPSRFEGLSNALLEAMACGLPVISTRVGGSRDIIEDGVNGLLVEVDAMDQLRDAMERVLRDRRLAAALGANARSAVETKHDMKSVANAYINLYRDLKSVNPAAELQRTKCQ
jgi:glycosyltransferase involved in cell wall biosynthesis